MKQDMLSADEIIDVSGYVGGQIKKSIDNYCFNEEQIKIDTYIDLMKDRSYSDWAWIGEQPGKWLEAVSAAKWYIKNDAAKIEKLNQVIAALKDAQQDTGYLGIGSAVTMENGIYQRPIRGMDAYEMYSTLNGLMEMYENYGEGEAAAQTALDTAKKLGDYLVSRIGSSYELVEGSDNLHKYEFWSFQNNADWQAATIAGHSVHEGLEGTLLVDPMMRLYQLTGDEKYIQWVYWVFENIDKWSIGHTPFANLDKVAAGAMGINEIQGYVHAHTFQMNFIAMLRMYRETGDQSYLNKVVGAYKDIISRQRFITGAVSVAEHYEAGYNLPNSGHVGETCASNSWSRMCYELLCLTGDTEYADAFEQLLYNHFLATQTIDGDGYSYHRELNGSTANYFTATLPYGPDCCSSSGIRMLNLAPYYLYGKSEDESGNKSIYINQYVPSEIQVKFRDGNGVELKQITTYPDEETIRLEVASDVETAIRMRIPNWAENAVVMVNGVKTDKTPTAGEYYEIRRKWEVGDYIEITLPMELKWVQGEYSNEGLWTIKKGPVVYCADTVFLTDDEADSVMGGINSGLDKLSYLGTEPGAVVNAEKLTAEETQKRAPKGLLSSLYKVKVQKWEESGAKQEEMIIAPFANVGYWYKGEEEPAVSSYTNAAKYQYAVWMTEAIEAQEFWQDSVQ